MARPLEEPGDRTVAPAIDDEKFKKAKPRKSGGNRSPKSRSRKTDTKANPKTGKSQASKFPSIPEGFGITVPRFIEFRNSVDEDVFIPLGFAFGRYLPTGDSASTLYSSIADGYLGRIIAKIRSLGYPSAYSVAQIRAYLDQVSKMHHYYRFISHIRALNDYSAIHTARPITALVSTAINGRLIAIHRALGKVLSNLPYPQKFYDAMIRGLDGTTLSDTPNSPIRIFAPKDLQPATSTALLANDLANELEQVMNDFFSVPANTELSAILPIGTVTPIETVSGYSYNPDVVNNLLNQSFWDGVATASAPFYADDVSVPFFYRRSMSPYSLMTFSPDDDLLTPPEAGTVWQVTNSLVDTTDQNMYVNNSGLFGGSTATPQLFQVFGTVWEASLALNVGNSPSLTKVSTNLQAVANGMSSLLLTEL